MLVDYLTTYFTLENTKVYHHGEANDGLHTTATAEGEALRRDDEFTFVSAWECNGQPNDANLHKEELVYENIELKQRSYK